MLSVINAFKAAHQLSDVTVIADAAMISEANQIRFHHYVDPVSHVQHRRSNPHFTTLPTPWRLGSQRGAGGGMRLSCVPAAEQHDMRQ